MDIADPINVGRTSARVDEGTGKESWASEHYGAVNLFSTVNTDNGEVVDLTEVQALVIELVRSSGFTFLDDPSSIYGGFHIPRAPFEAHLCLILFAAVPSNLESF